MGIDCEKARRRCNQLHGNDATILFVLLIYEGCWAWSHPGGENHWGDSENSILLKLPYPLPTTAALTGLRISLLD